MSDDQVAFRRSAEDLLAFLDASPTAWHAVGELARRLSGKGFVPLDEAQGWKLEPGGSYLVTRNGSALAAFILGRRPPREGGMRIVGAHVDSPALKLKPNPASARAGYVTLGVEVYGGPILATWTDRDLRMAGRVVVRTPGGLEPRLVAPERPVVVVPNLAIHLNRQVNDEGLKVNAQETMPAILSLETGGPAAGDAVVDLLAAETGVERGDVLGFDLMLVDAQGASIGGLGDVFLRSGRLDDLAMCHAGLVALCGRRDEPGSTLVLVCYDNEEVGSATAQGAASPFLPDLIERIVLAGGGGREDLMRTLSGSWLVSADMAHAVNPNHESKHDPEHRPVLGGGPVLKVNASMRYATDAVGWSLFENACREADVPLQRYVNRSDLPSGSTIGPIASSRLGLRTIDVGNPILAMHSIRETAGVRDHELMIRALASFYGG
jgi:aspartyl aminopeptidase